MASAPPRVVDPPFYDPPIVDYASGQQHSQAWTEYHQSVADRLTVIKDGVTDGSDATPGQIGEYMTASGSVTLATGALTNVVSLALTAGDWDVSGNVVFVAGAGTHSLFGTGIGALETYLTATFSTGALNQGLTTATSRHSSSGAATVWLVAEAAFTGTMSCNGTIRARRVR